MDKTLSYFFAFLFLFFISWCALVFGQVGRTTASSQWVFDVYAKKSAISKSIKEEKVIIVAGSNALFGCDSKMISEAFKKPVLNFGVNAGVLLPYTLYKAKEVINKGDTVLLPLEYPMYNYKGVPNSQMIDYIFARDIDAFFTLSLKEKFYMLWDITLKRVYEGYTSKTSKPVKSGLYGAHNVDENGDQTGATLQTKSKAISAELDVLVANKYGEKFDRDSLGFKYLKEFVSWCETKGAKCIFMPSTLMWFDSYKTDKKERWFYENIANVARSKGWKYIGEPYKYMYDKSFYFNTDFHLVESARKVRTTQMILDLRSSQVH